MTHRIVGLDLSLTASGVAEPDGVYTIRPKTKGMERLAEIRSRVLQACGPRRETIAVIEGYSYASAHQAHQMGELGGVVRLTLWQNEIRYVDVAPGQLKAFATGRGNAGKDEVLAAAIRLLDYEGHDNNEADADWLREMGWRAYGMFPERRLGTGAELNKARQAVLAKIAWPVLA